MRSQRLRIYYHILDQIDNAVYAKTARLADQIRYSRGVLDWNSAGKKIPYMYSIGYDLWWNYSYHRQVKFFYTAKQEETLGTEL